MELPENIEFFIKSRNLSERGEILYRKVFRVFLNFVKKEEFDQEDVLKFLIHLREKGRKERTISIYGTILRSYLKFCNKDISKIRLPRIPKRFKPALTEEELVKFFSVKMPLHYRLAYRLMAFSGLRVTEVLTMKVKDINFEERTIKIHGKGAKDRLVLMDEKTCEMLKDFVKDRKGIVFKELIPKSQNLDSAQRKIQLKAKTILKKAGLDYLENFTPHCLRATFSTIWDNKPGPRGMLRYLLGHTPDTTESYIRPRAFEIKEVYDKIINPIAKRCD